MLSTSRIEEKKVLNLKDFVYLLLGTLAKNSQIIDLEDTNKRVVALPVRYKQIIENILCADNGWKERFSCLIDIEEYFDNHFAWEMKLSIELKQALIDLNKSYEYDFEYDKLRISFTKEEVDAIMSKYQDEEINDKMDHFTNLLVDYIYTQEFQERFNDYYASTVEKMHQKLQEEESLKIEYYKTSRVDIKQKIKNMRLAKRK